MQITRNSIDTQKGPADWFTGDVYIDAVAAPVGSSTFAAALVHFTPGARTAWHTHPHGQTILVTEASGAGSARAARGGHPASKCRPSALRKGSVRVRSALSISRWGQRLRLLNLL